MTRQDIPDRWITIWQFRSVDGKQVVRGIRSAAPDDHRFEHEYQRIVYRGPQSGAPK